MPMLCLTKKPTYHSYLSLAPALTRAGSAPALHCTKLRFCKWLKNSGDPGAIRTRDPQLRRLTTKLAQVPDMDMISRIAAPIN